MESAGLLEEGQFPNAYGYQIGISAEIGWDGEPSYFQSADHDEKDDTDLYSINSLLNGDSSGQTRISQFNKMLSEFAGLKPPPKFVRLEGCNNIWSKCFDRQIAYLSTLKPTNRQTLLLDEPDRSMCLESQIDLWNEVLPCLSKHCQIIVASHSPASLFVKGANYVELTPNYAETNRGKIKKMASFTF